jgi:ABC-type polysaccharide/polyol phosphate export permease
MPKKGFLKRNTRQIFAIVEKEISLKLRYKSGLLIRIINPLIQLLILLFLFGLIFRLQQDLSIGYWNGRNYVLFILIAFCIQFSTPISLRYSTSFLTEKYWKTLSATMIAPINRFSLLIGILVSEVLIISTGVILLLSMACIIFPISIIHFTLFMLSFMSALLLLGSIGLIIGVYAMGNENFANYYTFFLRFVFLFSCINYPKEIFPEFIQIIIVLNPLYYYFDFLRLLWYSGLSPDIAMFYITPLHIFIFISLTIAFPIFSIYLFERIYKKYGIVGY